MNNSNYINVFGGGLAGCEAANTIAKFGIKVKLWEMRPGRSTPVHQSSNLAELVCSNSLKSELGDTAQGLLKQEMEILGSLLLECARMTRVPASAALAVDRELFAQMVTERICENPLIEVIRDEINFIPEKEISIIATGPLTSESMSLALQNLTGSENLFFYDAIAPSITAHSLNYDKVFRAARYDKGEADYLNCPFTFEEYNEFYENLIAADFMQGHEIDKKLYFQSCQPIEVIAKSGVDTLRFGPMRPVGLKPPNAEQLPYAVVQLRQEDKNGQVFGLVGFQTRMRWGDQDRVLRLIPGLEHAEFVRYGSMHRNTFVNSPILLKPTLQLKMKDNIFLAGQITGVEGYMESAASGIVAGINAAKLFRGENLAILPNETMVGALLNFICTSDKSVFQPMNANFGLMLPLPARIKGKKMRYEKYAERAIKNMSEFSELL